ncbi:MAG: family 16 glycosylhydrolase [Chitinivibrionia bacterium]|nr:family 16 glycosylhydrolase [Chitinivibrionia bacterium]
MRRLTLSFLLTVFLGWEIVSAQTITSMTATQGPVFNVSQDGGAGFTFPAFNGGAATFGQVGNDLEVLVSYTQNSGFVNIDANASGWIYNQNWGHFWEGGGGFWFHVEKTTYIRLQSRANTGVHLDYTLIYEFPARNGNAISANGETTITAGNDGNIGVPFPYIGGSPAKSDDFGKFVYKIQINGAWIDLDNTVASTFYYSSNGYNSSSPNNQYAIWYEGGGGIWFRPITQNYQFRIYYPLNAQTGGDAGDNYIEYTFIGNPNAPRPDNSWYADIPLSATENPAINGWTLHWNDEFDGNVLDESKWSTDYGYYLSDDPGTWGWGNNEAQWYSHNAKNVFVDNGLLNLAAYSNDPMTFQPQGGTANYSSGKVLSRDKFYWKYGRIDFRVKLPAVSGTWPACWMMPQENYYGGWASSGEIDVMEAKGRFPNSSSGAIHFGSAWPGNNFIGGEYHFPEGKTIANDFNVYSVIWEQDKIKWYVNGKCFNVASNTQWYSEPADGKPQSNEYSPFDRDFFIIMNLAVGGWFDPDAPLNPDNFPATMQIDYVRVYKPDPNGSSIVSAGNALKGAQFAFVGIRAGQINLNLKAGNYIAELYDLKGRLINKVEVNAINGINATSLRTDNLSKGVFFLKVKGVDGSAVLKDKILVK